MKSPKVSVIIPVFNAEKTIGGILDKLINQDYKNIEVIAVNDGSKDDSLKVIKEISAKDKRILIVDQRNAGVSAARNVGISKATGEFITFIDADDDFSENLITELVAASSDDVDFVMCGMSVNGKEVVAKESIVEGRKSIVSYVLSSLLTKNLFYGPYCKLFRRNLIEDFDLNFPENVNYGEDTIFVLNYLRHIDKLIVIRVSLYFYNYIQPGLAFSNTKNASFRRARTDMLNQFIRDHLSFGVGVRYLLVRARWGAAYLKAKLVG